MRSSTARREVPQDEIPPDLSAFEHAAGELSASVRAPRRITRAPRALPGRSTRWQRFTRRILGRGADPAAAAAPELADELLHLQRDLARRGITLRLPDPTLEWTLPEPIDFGVSVSDVVVRQRRGDP